MNGADIAESQFNVSPGDLLATIQTSRFPNRPTSNSMNRNMEHLASPLSDKELVFPLTQVSRPNFDHSQRQHSYDEDEQFRGSILACMKKAVGLTDVKSGMLARGTESVEQSPRLLSWDAKRQSATFSNAFGFIDSYDGSADGETESTVSTANASPLLNPCTSVDDLLDEI